MLFGCWVALTCNITLVSEQVKLVFLVSFLAITQRTAGPGHCSWQLASCVGMASVHTHSSIVLRRCLNPRLSVASCNARRSALRHAYVQTLLLMDLSNDIKGSVRCCACFPAGHTASPVLHSSPLPAVCVILRQLEAHVHCSDM